MKENINAAHWSEYWKSGNTTTFNNGLSEGYDLEIKRFWQSFFSTINSNTTIVDLGCGNGAIPSILFDISREKSVTPLIYAVDYAKVSINPPSDYNVDRFQLLPETLIEDTSIKEQSVDWVVSQYGIEYADLNRAINEVVRIGKSNVKLACIMHSEDSAILKEASLNLEHANLCYKKLNVLNNVKKLLRVIDGKDTTKLKPSTNKKAEKIRNNINKELAVLNNIIKSPGHSVFVEYFVSDIMKIFKKDFSKGKSLLEKLRHLSDIEGEIKKYMMRLNSLKSAAMSKEAIESFTDNLTQKGFSITLCDFIQYQNHRIGYKIIATK